MNKQEINEKLKENGAWCTECHTGVTDRYVKIRKAMELVEWLDEPQKPVVPKFVAEWIEKHCYRGKHACLELFMCQYNDVELPTDLYNYYDSNREGARDKVINAILYGYEVEKEPMWVVAVHGGEYYFTRFMSNHNPEDRFPWDSIMDKNKGYQFSDKDKAEAVALLTDGTVEEV